MQLVQCYEYDAASTRKSLKKLVFNLHSVVLRVIDVEFLILK
jgi:hypothetical protein